MLHGDTLASQIALMSMGSAVPLRHAAWPAGRILHIVPARLLYPGAFPAASPAAAPKDSLGEQEGTAAAQQHDASTPKGQQQSPAAPRGASPLSSLRPSPLETVASSDEALSTAPFSPHGMDRADLDEELGDSRMSGLSPGTGLAEEKQSVFQRQASAPQRPSPESIGYSVRVCTGRV